MVRRFQHPLKIVAAISRSLAMSMTLTDLVAPAAIIPALKVNNKKQAIQELAARAASSWIACFLLLSLSAGIIAAGATRSVSVMDMANDREMAATIFKGC